MDIWSEICYIPNSDSDGKHDRCMAMKQRSGISSKALPALAQRDFS